jgi:hypothetical protein
MTRIRKSVPTQGVHEWWMLNWEYIMPDFDNPVHSIIEWSGAGVPLEPDSSNRVSETTTDGDARGSGPQQQRTA